MRSQDQVPCGAAPRRVPMYTGSLMLTVAAFALVSCNPFRNDTAVQVSTKDENLNSRWHANLATPAELAGAVQMNGSASMAPATKSGNTTVVLALANATPGGLH